MKIFLTFLFAVTCSFGVVAEARTWTSTEGKVIQADIVRANDTTVTLKLENGKSSSIKLSLLSEEDQTYVKEWSENEKVKEQEAKKKDKLAKITSFRWEKSYKKALQEAQELDLPLAILFTGTNWCGYCIKLEEEVFSKPLFKKLAAGKFIGLKVDAPSNKGPKSKEGQELAKKYAIRGYPSVVYINKDEEFIDRSGYHAGISPESFVKNVENLKTK